METFDDKSEGKTSIYHSKTGENNLKFLYNNCMLFSTFSDFFVKFCKNYCKKNAKNRAK